MNCRHVVDTDDIGMLLLTCGDDCGGAGEASLARDGGVVLEGESLRLEDDALFGADFEEPGARRLES